MFKKPIFKICTAVACGTILYNKWIDFNSKPIYALSNNSAKSQNQTSTEYPELSFNRNIMSRNLTEHMYAKLRDRQTPNGYTIDDAIQTGVDNIGKHTTPGIVAGDEESYKIFSDIYDKVIEEKHFGYTKYQEHRTNLNVNDLKINEPFDPNYVLNFRIKTVRNIRGFCFPTFCSRGERRKIETLIINILFDFDDKRKFKYSGVYYPIGLVNDKEEEHFKNLKFWLDRPYNSRNISSYLFRDWPDARGLWLSDDENIAIYLNRKDHCLITVHENSSDFRKVFEKFSDVVNELENHLKENKYEFMHNKHLGYLTSCPSNLGTAMKISVHIKIPNLSKDARLIVALKKLDLNINYKLLDENKNQIKKLDANKNTIVEISSLHKLGKSEVEIAQSFGDSIKRLIEMEKSLENGGEINDVL